jgi:hypothetical protein
VGFAVITLCVAFSTSVFVVYFVMTVRKLLDTPHILENRMTRSVTPRMMRQEGNGNYIKMSFVL